MKNDQITADIRDILKGRPVLVTGADGFVGSHLTEKLVDFGANVHALVRPTSAGTLQNIQHIKDKVTLLRAHLADQVAVRKAIRTLGEAGERPVIFHLAAQAHVGESWSRPYETIESTTISTINILQAVVDLGLDIYKLDTAGSSEEFGNVNREFLTLYRFGEDGGVILNETSPLNPQSVYATSKVAADFLTRNFCGAYGVPTVVTRMFNNYGPRQNPRFITGTIITQALTRNFVELGFVDAKRDFCFVEDGAMGHIHSTLFGEPGQIYVYGYGQNVTIGEWFDMINRLGEEMGHWQKRELVLNERKRGRIGKSEVMELRVDFRKLNALTGWHPNFTWEDGLRRTIDWYASHRDAWIGRVDW